MKILIGVDDSSYSKAAVEFIRRMTWPAGTSVTVVAVARTPVMLSTEMYAPGLAYDDQVMKAEIDYRSQLAETTLKQLTAPGLTVTAQVITGDPRLELVDVARKESTDLIIIGSHGRTGLARLLLGSVASYVVSHAPCSVMVVKSPHA